ncbi:hypothetical protein ACEQ8H_007768 [Pleosporales sp. CAS-2024a]
MASQNPQTGATGSTQVYRSDVDFFEPTPLSSKPNAIRLLTILPDLTNAGLIQCNIRHATTDADYTCLSYVWGAEAHQEIICINGKAFTCRKNLWDFLHVARTKYAGTTKDFWIDAICINQVSLPERNQQVGQMGNIYAKATNVLATAEFLIFLSRLVAEGLPSEKDARRVWYREINTTLRRSYLDFEANEYWTRAWITQEILTPKEMSILANETQIYRPELEGLELLLPLLQASISEPVRKTFRESQRGADRCFKLYVRAMAGCAMSYQWTGQAVEKRLFDLLFLLGPRQCQVPRDRVYSLLSVADDANLVLHARARLHRILGEVV